MKLYGKKSFSWLIRNATEAPAFNQQRRRHPSRSDDFAISRDQSVAELDLFRCLGMLLDGCWTASSKATSSQPVRTLKTLSGVGTSVGAHVKAGQEGCDLHSIKDSLT